MFRKFLINLASVLTNISLIVGSVRVAGWFWNWHYELTQPDRDREIREVIKRALGGDGEQ